MNKDIIKNIDNCALGKREKARTQVYPIQMTDIHDTPFDKIAIDLVSDHNISASGNQHLLTLIDQLTGWPEAFPISNEKADTTACISINNNLLSTCALASDNGTEFINHLMHKVLKQPGINSIFSAPYHPQSNGKLEVFDKYLKPTLMKLCEKDPDNWDKYINYVLASYSVTPHLGTAQTPFFLVYAPLHQLLEPMQ